LKGSKTNQTQDSKTYQTPGCSRLQALFKLDNHDNSAKIQLKNLIRDRQKIQLATNDSMKL
jgi:capsid portal protein